MIHRIKKKALKAFNPERYIMRKLSRESISHIFLYCLVALGLLAINYSALPEKIGYDYLWWWR